LLHGRPFFKIGNVRLKYEREQGSWLGIVSDRKGGELAMKLGQEHLAAYGATTSRPDFAQRQLTSCLILRAYLKTTYRGVLGLLAVSPRLRELLRMTEKLPHFTTLQKIQCP
jgi:hypothetical protein